MKMNIYTLSYEIYVFIISHHTKAVKQILPTFLWNMAQTLYVCKILRLPSNQYQHTQATRHLQYWSYLLVRRKILRLYFWQAAE